MDTPFDYQILRLTAIFYRDYPQDTYPELLLKSGRSYNCLLIESHYGYFICVPYRTNIHHKNAFLFKNTKRSSSFSSGLDYSKIVIVNNPDYVSSKPSIIDKDEFFKTRKFIDKIKNEVLNYVDTYVNHFNGSCVLNNVDFQRKYSMSTLKYFHKELGIKPTKKGAWKNNFSFFTLPFAVVRMTLLLKMYIFNKQYLHV